MQSLYCYCLLSLTLPTPTSILQISLYNIYLLPLDIDLALCSECFHF